MNKGTLTGILVVLLSLSVLCGSFAPAIASAQTTPPATTGQNANQGQSNAPATCSISFRNGVDWNFTDCIWIPMMSWLGTFFLIIGSYALSLSGYLFDTLIQYFIIQFNTTLTNMGAITAINTGWTIFRDLSNIIIIGMFTFIAIATILGNTEYGYKKLLSRVLIVAVLINFSLLFAKIIIDAGNFTSFQIYQAIAQSPQLQGQLQSSGSQFDIASAFLRPMGVTGVYDTKAMLQQFGQTANSGLQAFALGLVGGLLLIALAIVMLYGCFLIAARAVTLVILMITASMAFASYLHPKLSESEYGWRGWWKTLMNAALFGPLLMLFLAISLMIVNGANTALQTATGAGQNNSIGAAVFNAMTNPGQSASAGAGWGVILLYIFGIGLLFVSLRLASSFASSVGGLSFGQVAWERFANNALAGLSGTGRFFGQQTGGRFAYNREQAKTADARSKLAQAAQARLNGNTLDAKNLEKAAERSARAAVRAGQFSGAYKKGIQERAKKVADVVQKVQPSKEMREAQVQAAEETKRAATATAAEMEKTLRETQKQSADAAKTVAEELGKEIANNPTLKAEHDSRVADVEKESAENVKKIGDKYAEQVKQITEEINRGGIADSRKQELQKQLLQGQEAQKSEMRHESERVERARRAAMLNTANSEAAKAVMEKNGALRDAAQKLSVLNMSEQEESRRLDEITGAKTAASALPGRREVTQAHADAVDSMIQQVSEKQTGYFGTKVGKSDEVADAARKKFKSDSQNRSLRQALNSQLDESKDEGKKEGSK